MKLTTSYSFKFVPTLTQEDFLESYFSRFSKAVNFFAKKIQIVEEGQRNNYEFIKKDTGGSQGLNGKCSYCLKSYVSCKGHKPEGKNRNDRNKICKTCGQKSLIIRKKKDGIELVCGKCWNKEFSIRKILYATGNRKRSQYGDVRDAVKLPGTEYALAFKRANDTLNSYKKQLNNVYSTIFITQRRAIEWQEVLDNDKIASTTLKKWLERYKNNAGVLDVLNRLKDEIKQKNTTSRFTLPRQQNQRVDRYKHILFKENPSRGKTESTIRGTIEALNKTIEKLQKRLKETKVLFKGNIVDLQNTSVKDINEQFVKLSIDGKQEKFTLIVNTIKSEKNKSWFLDIIRKIKEGELKYPLLLRKRGNFYLSYPLVQEFEEPKIDSKTKIMGIDRGVNQTAVTAVVDKPNGKPCFIKFYPGHGLMAQKTKYQLIRKKFTGTKGVNKRRAQFGKKVARISDYMLHNFSRQIVNQAKELKPIVIAMEKLKITQGEKRIKKGTALQERKIRFMLSNFSYGKLQKLIEYKALKAGIPIRFINPEYTSQICSMCHKTGDRNKGFFRCVNRECGHNMNADLNAAINIANALYKEIKI